MGEQDHALDGAPASRLARAAEGLGRRHRSVVAALALVSALSLVVATSQLAGSTEGPGPAALGMAEPPPATPTRALVRPPPPAVPVVRQAVIAPLAVEVTRDPALSPFVTPDLAEVTPLAAPAARPTPSPSALSPPAVVPFGEPLPAVARPDVFTFPIPVVVPAGFDFGCPSITFGPVRLALLCRG